MNDEEKAKVIRKLVEGLRKEGWIGKTHIQKAVLFAQEAAGLDLGFRYVIHHYGPYSFELANFVDGLDRQGILNITRESDGYGFEVLPGEGRTEGTLSPRDDAKVDLLVKELQGTSTSNMELLATAFYISHRYGGDQSLNVSRIHALKPKFSEDEIEKALKRADEIATVLSS